MGAGSARRINRGFGEAVRCDWAAKYGFGRVKSVVQDGCLGAIFRVFC